MPSRSSGSPVAVSVRVVCSEVVISGGTRITQWHVHEQSKWLPAHRHPSCVSERGQAGPGTVWQETLLLQLLPGTRLKQVIAEPLPPKTRSAFDYLRRQTRGIARKTREILYTVGRTGELSRSPQVND